MMTPDHITVAFMVAGSVMAAMLGFTVMNMVYGYSLTIPYDPDFMLYKNNTAAWSDEITWYVENDVILPLSKTPTTNPNMTGDLKSGLCCSQFPK